MGVRPSAEQLPLAPGVRLAAVVEPPTAVELAAALREPLLFGALARLMPAVAAELQVDRTVAPLLDTAAGLAEPVVAGLQIRTGGAARVPAVADHSWSTLAAITDGRCGARLLDEAATPPAGAPVLVGPDDAGWAWTHRRAVAALGEAARFRLALDALTGHHRERNRRLALLELWVGLEALLGVPAPEDRLGRYVAEALDGDRPGEALETYVQELRRWLQQGLVACVETGRLPAGGSGDAGPWGSGAV